MPRRRILVLCRSREEEREDEAEEEKGKETGRKMRGKSQVLRTEVTEERRESALEGVREGEDGKDDAIREKEEVSREVNPRGGGRSSLFRQEERRSGFPYERGLVSRLSWRFSDFQRRTREL